MANKNNRSSKIWAFLDKDVSAKEKAKIQHLIATNEAWKKEFKAAQKVQFSLNNLQQEQPSMRFAKNILDQLPVQKTVFIQPKGLLSVKAKILAISAFSTSLLLSVLYYFPSIEIEKPSFIYPTIQNELNYFVNLFSFEAEISTYILILFGMLLILMIDHFIYSKFMRTS